ncbi:hypothetical protein GF391_00685 [Candidatus Uhrbacteria bacterium]|nr:hypothetical protein [Candidatus Uhrbacteria bacterium]
MSGKDMRAAIALYVICLLASWSWVAHRIHPLSFGTGIFTLILTVFCFYTMWRVVQYTARQSGWKQIGFVSKMEPTFMALRYPLYLQAILDINFILALLTAEYLNNFQRFFMLLLDLCVIFFIARKWHEFMKSSQFSTLRSL